MEFGLFEHMAHDDNLHRVERRKALALARVRANKRFGRFLESSHQGMDRESRLTLVAGELNDTVRQACAEVGYSDWEPIRDAITASLGFTIEAVRMPKMCPYHREVTDISLAAGQPDAGFSAMAQHAWSANHCQGDWEGKCNFKPAMTTQTFWDDKEQKSRERREERQRQQEVQQELTPVETPALEVDNIIEPEIAVHEELAPSESLETAPSIADLQPAMAAVASRLKFNTLDFNDPTVLRHFAEALKTIDVEQKEGPVSPINKDRWTPQNITWDKDAEMEGTPVPTRHQDITQKSEYTGDGGFSDDNRFEQMGANLEHQDVTQDSKFSPTQKPAQLPSQAQPVTSAEDPDKNPLRKDEEDEDDDE